MSINPFAAENPTIANTSQAVVVVYERSARWASGVRIFVDSGTQVVETRTTDDAWRQISQSPHGVLLLEVDAQRASAILALMVRVKTELPQVMILAGASFASSQWELLLREAGAAMVLSTPRKLLSLRQWISRHLACVPQTNKSPLELVWDQLPWPASAPSSPH